MAQKTISEFESENRTLANLDQAVLLISQAKSIDEAFALRAIFKVAEIEARRNKSILVEKKAVEYKLWTIDRIGQMLTESKKNGQRAKEGNNQHVSTSAKTLAELHISPMMSSRYQKFHKLPEREKIEIINNAVRRIERRQYIEKEKNTSDIPKDWLVRKPLTISERIDSFHRHFPNVPRMMRSGSDMYDHIYGMWELGIASMKQSEYWGAYPPTFLEKMLSFFTDCATVIHLFAGSIKSQPPRVITYDINPKSKPTICDDICNIKNHAEIFRKPNLLVMADPYYEDKDFERQGRKPINKKKVLDDLCELVPRGTFVTWLDTVSLVWSSEIWDEVGLIGVKVGSNTRYRGCQIFRRK